MPTGSIAPPTTTWNRPVESNAADSVIHVNGSSDLYLVAYHQHEFVDLHYEKLLRKRRQSASPWHSPDARSPRCNRCRWRAPPTRINPSPSQS